MRRLRALGAFWYDFIVGDDWRIAVGVVIGLGLSALAVHSFHVAVWWLLPVVVVGMLTASLWLAVREE